jgi:uncharacterized protein YceK
MKNMIFIPLMSAAILSGCGAMQKGAKAPAVEYAPAVATTTLMPAMGQATAAATLDQASAAEKAAAVAPKAAGERKLGTAVVALGSPAEQGFWLKSSLVTAAGKGRVVTASGASVNVDLMPASGAASLSFSAFRALGLGLTDLPDVTIYAN